jgi:hypothetical protein
MHRFAASNLMCSLNRLLTQVVGWFAAALLASPAAAQVDVLTQHNDNSRSGANRQETRLNTSNVNAKTFGKLAFRLVDGNVFAQPLIVSQARIAGRTGATNVAIVATAHNSVYAFDAEDTNQASTSAQLWHTGPAVLGTPVQSTEVSAAVGLGPAGCTDLTTELGIISTPAIALTRTAVPKEGVVFVVGKSKNANQHVYRLFALNLADGTVIGQTSIQGEVDGTGFGAVGKRIRFDPRIQLNRPALLVHNGVLYVAFGGHCDYPRPEPGSTRSYHGWLFAYDVSSPKAMKRLDVFCTTPNGKGSRDDSRAGIWMSGQGPAVADDGSIYLSTGDGTYNPKAGDFANSVLRITLVKGKLQVRDWYSPQNRDTLTKEDADLGAGGVVPLPTSHLLLAGGKEGRLYLIDRDAMGRGITPSLDSFQVTHAKDGHHYYNLHGAPVIWARQGHMFMYVNGEEDALKQYKLVPDPGKAGWKFDSAAARAPFQPLTPFARSVQTAPYPNFPKGLFGQHNREMVWMPGGTLSLSANGEQDGTGIIWVNMPYANQANRFVVRGVLRAFDASDVSRAQLWESEDTGNDHDRLGQYARFSAPTVANGKVYIGTFHAEIIGTNNVHHKAPGGDQPALAIYGLK